MAEKKENTRVCSICKELIYINDPTENYFYTIKKDGKSTTCTHSLCYIEYHTTKSRNALSLEECVTFVEKQKKENNDIIRRELIKKELYEFLFEMYNVSFFPNYFYVKMNSIFDGTHKNLNRPVLPEDLLDMWKQKRNYLNKVAEQNRKKDKEMTNIGRINYDLAILLTVYDSYLAWKEQQKILLAETNEQKKRNIDSIEYTDVIRPRKSMSKIDDKKVDIGTNKVNKVDIDKMLDEI